MSKKSTGDLAADLQIFPILFKEFFPKFLNALFVSLKLSNYLLNNRSCKRETT